MHLDGWTEPLYGQHLHRTPSALYETGVIYFEEITDGFQVRRVIRNWTTFYNTGWPHSSLERRTSEES